MSTQTKITPATKYRVAVRDIAIQNGWTFTQLNPQLDKFEKNGTVIAVSHGPSNLISTAEKLTADNKHDVTERSGKMFQVQEWLTGIADPNHERYIRLTPEQVKRYESGQGIAKLTGVFTATPADEPVLAPKPKDPAKKATKPTVKVTASRSNRKTLTDDEIAAAKRAAAGPAKRPTPRAAAKAPAVKA